MAFSWRGCVVVLLALVFVLAGHWLTRPQTTPAAPPSNGAVANPPAAGAEPVTSAEQLAQIVTQASAPDIAYDAFINRLPVSLADVPRPAPLTLDENGQLVVDSALRNLFEYYLSALGEEPLEHVIARIKHDLTTQLPPLASAQGIALLTAYIQFRNHQGVLKNDFEQQSGDQSFSLTAVRELVLAERQARAMFFEDAHSQALFGDEDAAQDYLLARLAITTNDNLSASERSEQLAQLEKQAPASVRASRAADILVETVAADDALVASYVDDAAVFSARAAQFGEATATRLQARDQQRAAWQAKVAAYRVELRALLGSAGQAPDPTLLAQLRDYHFTGPERIRIVALDKLELGLASAAQ